MGREMRVRVRQRQRGIVCPESKERLPCAVMIGSVERERGIGIGWPLQPRPRHVMSGILLDIQNILDLAPTNSVDALEGFDAIASLNELFPDEASLVRASEIQEKLHDDVTQIQTEIDSLRAELRKDQEPARMQLIQELIAVRELLAQMSRIREKATESEAIVRDITKDIQVLDLAKRNLALSVTALKRFQMLGVSAREHGQGKAVQGNRSDSGGSKRDIPVLQALLFYRANLNCDQEASRATRKRPSECGEGFR
ncbi:hypothetical protein AG1IA_09898 [Rhizoctonia solani AG-1 IA]|uniref:Vps53 N-terminal domain-containing protein n=1 Tax=Thanatephorus cucumeris (strain AG1-IA) TaxID=983506 RepID=L8WH64_THACA|nr:hypothetical protein AG1IA_09898 [Rhizoctonia solani AG-1 IA]